MKFLLLFIALFSFEAASASYYIKTVGDSSKIGKKKLSVSSIGYEDTLEEGESSYERRLVVYDGVEYPAGRSWQLIIIDSDTDEVESVYNFDVFNNNGNRGEDFRVVLENVEHGKFFIINTYDEPKNNMNAFSDILVGDFGATKLDKMMDSSYWSSYRSSYYLVGRKGVGVIAEDYANRRTNGVSSGVMYVNP